MRKKLGIPGVCLLLAGCGPLALMPSSTPDGGDGETRPQSRPEALEADVRRPPASARTEDEFDTTTAEERQAAATPASGGTGQALGTTIVSLGDPARPGFWLETPLASAAGSGRVVYPETGQSAQVALIPIEGGGSRMSLSAMRLIGVPLTGLVEVQVFSGG